MGKNWTAVSTVTNEVVTSQLELVLRIVQSLGYGSPGPRLTGIVELQPGTAGHVQLVLHEPRLALKLLFRDPSLPWRARRWWRGSLDRRMPGGRY